MILKLFKQSYFIQISSIFVFAVLLLAPGFLQDGSALLPNNTLFLHYTNLLPLIPTNWIYQIINSILLITLAFYVRSILKHHQLIHSQNLLPVLIFISFFNFQTPYEYQLISILNLFLIALSYKFILQSFEDEKPDYSIFSASLFISLASFFSYANLSLLPLIWISFFVFQNYNWRYFPISIIGLFTPYLFLFTWIYWIDKTDVIIHEWNVAYLHFFQWPQMHGLTNIIISSLIGFFVLSSLAKIIPEIPSKIIAIRKKTSLSLWFLFISLYPFLFIPDSITKNLILIPLLGLLGYYLSRIKTRRIWIDLLFSIFIIFIIFSKYYLLYA